MSNKFSSYRSVRKGAASLFAVIALALVLSMSASAAPGGPADKPQTQTRPSDTQYFQDVAVGSFFYSFTAALYTQGVVSGFACGTPPAGACVPPANLPYYVPSGNVTRGQMSIFIENARTKPGISVSDTTGNYVYSVFANNIRAAGVGVGGNVSGNGSGRGSIGELSEGVYATSSGTTNSVGFGGYAANDNAAWFDTGAYASGFYGLFIAHGGAQFGNSGETHSDVYVAHNLVVGGSKTGYVVDIMQNTGNTDLHPGEVAALSGAAATTAQVGDIPVAGAATTGKAYDSGVLGVVDQKWVPADPNAPLGTKFNTGYYDEAADVIHPGEYMGVVTLGAYKGLKVDATKGAIHVGDLLVSSTTAGAAMKGDDKQMKFGTVIGKALGGLDSGTGTIPVMVTLK